LRQDALTFSLEDSNNTFQKVFVSSTGRMSITLDQVGDLNVTLYASTVGSKRIPLGTLNLRSQNPDYYSASGQSSESCDNGHAIDDGIPQNGKFTCNCNDGYVLSNADNSNPTCVADWTLTVALVGVVAIALILLIVWRVQVYRIKCRPIDVNAIQQQLLAELGLGATADIKDTEVGVVVTVGTLNDQGSELNPTTLHKLQRAVKDSALQAIAGKLDMAIFRAWVQPIYLPWHALVIVFQKPSSYSADEFATKVAEFDTELKVAPILLPGVKLTAALVALPNRTPRDILRRALTRVGVIASGNFGEVFKGELSESHMGRTLKVIVAVKVCKGKSGGNEQENLLKEAALMALFEHRNVLSLIGVITAPRDMPAMLVLEHCDNGSLLDYIHKHVLDTATSTKLTFCAEVAQGLGYISSLRVVHRDVAARNILLDAMLVCKVADFGLATALADSKEYARLDESDDDADDKKALPLRWAAPEVIIYTKFSTKSDV